MHYALGLGSTVQQLDVHMYICTYVHMYICAAMHVVQALVDCNVQFTIYAIYALQCGGSSRELLKGPISELHCSAFLTATLFRRQIQPEISVTDQFSSNHYTLHIYMSFKKIKIFH